MGHDDRFDDLIASLAGFHRSWLIYLGIELGLFGRVRAAGHEGITPSELASATDTQPEAVAAWSWASDAHDLVVLEDGRLTIDDDVAEILLDDQRAEFLGGQFDHAVVASMDWGGMVDFFRTGRADRYAPRSLPGRDRAPDPPGHRGVLPGGARGAAPARGRPQPRRPGRRRALRRRSLAGRDGPPIPQSPTRRRGVRGGFGRPGPRDGRRGGAPGPHRDPPGQGHGSRQGG